MFPPFLFSWRVFKNLYSFFFKCLVEFTREASWAQDFLWIGFGYSFNLFMSIPIFYFFLNQFQSFVCFWEFVGFSYYLIYWHRVRSIHLKFFFFISVRSVVLQLQFLLTELLVPLSQQLGFRASARIDQQGSALYKTLQLETSWVETFLPRSVKMSWPFSSLASFFSQTLLCHLYPLPWI